MSHPLRLVPLGGLGEVGMNCLALEQGNDILLIDCGVTFPLGEPGVDVIHPDFRWIRERADRVRALVLTHGHDDHIGGAPYLLRQIGERPVYGPPYALALLKNRMSETAPRLTPDLRPTRPRVPYEVGSFRIEPIRVTHSIPDATALVLHTAAGIVVHTGDFNIDEDPLDGEHFDADRLAEVGDAGVRLLLSDSTNVDTEGDSGRERTVVDALADLVASAPERVVVSLFASNLHRMSAVIDLARRTGRKILPLGRSLHTHMRAGIDVGRLRDPGAIVVPEDRAQAFPRDRLLVLATGTQGEPPAALTRLAAGTHPVLELEPDDTVVLSSRIIPGHEQAVFAVIDDLLRRGVRVVHRKTDPRVHVSGHAAREEQRRMIELVRPAAFVPVHGTRHHLTRHAALAREMGIDDTLVAEDGAIIEVDGAAVGVRGRAPAGRVHIEAGEPLDPDVLRDRALLAEAGLAIVVLVVDGDGRLTGEPAILTRGVVSEERAPEVAAEAGRYVATVLGRRGPSRSGPARDDRDGKDLEARARSALKRYLLRSEGRRPLVQALTVRRP